MTWVSPDCFPIFLQGKPYYLVKNSWGESGDYKGTWYMSRDYMVLNTTYLFLNRYALSKDLDEKIRKTGM